jgi:hypothetical protein
MITASEREIILSNPLLRSRAAFMEMAREVCEEVGVDAAMVFNPLRGNDVVVAARDAIIKIAHCRGYPARKIAMMIGRDTSSVLHSLRKVTL